MSRVSSRSSATWVLKWAHQKAPLAPKASPNRANTVIHSSTDRVKMGKRTERRAA